MLQFLKVCLKPHLSLDVHVVVNPLAGKQCITPFSEEINFTKTTFLQKHFTCIFHFIQQNLTGMI